MITLPLSFATEADVLTAYRAAGGVIGGPSNGSIINCGGDPPRFFDKWTYRASDQLPNLYKGMLDMQEVEAVQAPSQQNGWTRLDVIQRELKDAEFVSAHAAEWYMRPKNFDAFLRVCPSGTLVFLEKYRRAVRILRVVHLFVRDGLVVVDAYYANDNDTLGAWDRFAVRRKLSV